MARIRSLLYKPNKINRKDINDTSNNMVTINICYVKISINNRKEEKL